MSAALSRSSKPSVQYPIRVVYYVEGYAFGGVERHLLHLLDELDRRRFDPMVLGVMADELEPELVARHVPVVRLDRIRGNFDIPGFIRAFRAIRKARPVVFHAMLSHSHAAQYAVMSAIALRTPAVVTTAHLPTESDNQMRRRLARFILRGVDMQVLPSEWTKAELVRLGELHGSYEIVANGIALPALLSRDEAREQLAIARGATVIGGSMRLDDWKRPELIVDAARGLPDAVVVILGEGSEEERLRSWPTGWTSGCRASASTPSASCPPSTCSSIPARRTTSRWPSSRPWRPGFRWSSPIRAAPRLMVDDGRTGLRAPATPAGMSGAVSRLLDDPVLAGRLAAAGRDEVLSRFTTQAMTRQLEDLYERLLATDGRAPERPPEGMTRVDRRRVLTLDPLLRRSGWRRRRPPRRTQGQDTPAGSRASSASASVTMRSCSARSRRAARGLQRPRMKKMRTAKTNWPARHTPHQRFHSPGEAFCAGTSFCSATRRLARFCEWAPTLAVIFDWLTGWPF